MKGTPICKLNIMARGLAQLKNIGFGNFWNGISIVVNTLNKIGQIQGYINGYKGNF